jgi:hypothetical protein
MMKRDARGARPAARTADSTPHWRKISIVRVLMPRALGWMEVPGVPLHEQRGHAESREQDGGGEADRTATGDEDVDLAHGRPS